LLPSSLIALGAQDRSRLSKTMSINHTAPRLVVMRLPDETGGAIHCAPISLERCLLFWQPGKSLPGPAASVVDPLALISSRPPETRSISSLAIVPHIVNDFIKWCNSTAPSSTRATSRCRLPKIPASHLLIGFQHEPSPRSKNRDNGLRLSWLRTAFCREIWSGRAWQITRDISRDPTQRWIVHSSRRQPLVHSTCVGILSIVWRKGPCAIARRTTGTGKLGICSRSNCKKAIKR